MDDLDALAAAGDGFLDRFSALSHEQLFVPTPCEGWNAAELTSHVIGGNHMAVRLLEGAERPEATGYLAGLPLGEDPRATVEESLAAQLAAFSDEGAMERICEHPVADLPGSAVLRFRVGDLLLHTWDLAVATGGDTDLHPEVVQRVWEDLSPMKDNIAMTGVFGDGPSGTVGEDAPLQVRLLDLAGRRP